MTHEKMGGGPYREAYDQDAADLERMRKQIEAEGKIPIQLDENTKMGDPIPLFENTDPKKFVFYSLFTDALKYKEMEEPFRGFLIYRYENTPDSKTWLSLLSVLVEEKAYPPAVIFSLITGRSKGKK